MDRKQLVQTLALNLLYGRTKEESLYPAVKEKFKSLSTHMKAVGKEIYFVSGFRSFKEQDDLYAKGRTTPGSIVTQARGGESYHNYCLAFDVAFKEHNWNPPKGYWEHLGLVGRSLGLVWGGDFNDPGHFEYHPDLNSEWKALKEYFKLLGDIEKAESGVEWIALNIKKIFL